jgi:hypothetical protein
VATPSERTSRAAASSSRSLICTFTTYGTKAFRGFSKLADISRKLPLRPAIALGQASSAIRICVRPATNMPNGNGFQSSPIAASPRRQIQGTTNGMKVNTCIQLGRVSAAEYLQGSFGQKAVQSAIEPKWLFRPVRTGAGLGRQSYKIGLKRGKAQFWCQGRINYTPYPIEINYFLKCALPVDPPMYP